MTGLGPCLPATTLALCCGLLLACGGDGAVSGSGGRASTLPYSGGRIGSSAGTAGHTASGRGGLTEPSAGGSHSHAGASGLVTSGSANASGSSACGSSASTHASGCGGQVTVGDAGQAFGGTAPLLAGAGSTSGGNPTASGGAESGAGSSLAGALTWMGGASNGGDPSTNAGAGAGGSLAGAAGGTGLPPVSCGDFIPCGGDLTGTWRPGQRCIETTTASGTATMLAACADLYADSGMGPASTVTFDGAGVAVAATEAGTERSIMTYSQQCLSAVRGKSIAPDDMSHECAAMSIAPTSTDTGMVTVECSMDVALCRCTVISTVDSPQSATKPFTTHGSTLTLDGNSVDYCVEGNSLKIGSASTGAFTLYVKL